MKNGVGQERQGQVACSHWLWVSRARWKEIRYSVEMGIGIPGDSLCIDEGD